MQASNMWVVLKDPREHKKEAPKLIKLTPEQQAELDREDLEKSISTNLLEVISKGNAVKDPHIIPGCTVAVDPRQPAIILPVNNDESVLVVAESQIMVVFD